MGSALRPRLALALLLATSVGAKLALNRSPPNERPDPLPAATALLRARGFDEVRPVPDGPLVFGRRGSCEVLVAGVAALDWQADALRRLAPPGATISVVSADGGSDAARDARFGTAWLKERLGLYFGIRPAPRPSFAIIAAPECVDGQQRP